MKAALFQQYGPPEVMQIVEVEKPTPEDNEVLIRVHASTVTSGDARVRRADPFLVRLFFGLRAPKKHILGSELSGEIVAIGKNVTQFNIGDRVLAYKGADIGASAEYVTMPEDGLLATIPAHIPYDEAASITFGGTASLFFLEKQGEIQAGQNVLIYGASGALGVTGVQLAKHFGAEVTAVCSTRNISLMKSLGADHVVDYTKEDFTQNGKKYDLIYDTIGKSPFKGSLTSLTAEGRFVRAVHMAPGVLLKGLWANLTTKKKVLAGVAYERRQDILLLRDLLVEGKLKAVIGKRFPVEKIVEAHRHVDGGHKQGTVILTWG